MEAGRIELTGVYRVMLRAVQYDNDLGPHGAHVAGLLRRGRGQVGRPRRGHATAEFTGVAGFNEGMWRVGRRGASRSSSR